MLNKNEGRPTRSPLKFCYEVNKEKGKTEKTKICSNKDIFAQFLALAYLLFL